MSENNGNTMTADSADSAVYENISTENTIADNTIVFVLKIRMIGNSKGIATKHAAKRKKGVTASKSLLDCPEYDALTTKANEIRSYMRCHQVPNCDALLLQDSAFPVPLDMVEEVDEWLKRACKDFNTLHKILITNYDKRKLESYNALQKEQLVLNDTELKVVDLSDFKTLEQVRCDIGIEYRMVSYSTPIKLRDINKAIFQRETNKIKSIATETMEGVVGALLKMSRDCLDHLIDLMTPGEDNKSKSLKGDPIEKAKEMFDRIRSMNVTKNAELDAISKQCRQILDGTDTEVLRDSQATRLQTARLLKQIKKTVDAAVVKAPSRKILLDD